MEPEISTTKKSFNILRWVLIVGIVVVLNLFFNYAIDTVYHMPKFEDFCQSNKSEVNISPTSREQCLAEGGQWNESANTEKIVPATVSTTKISGYCDIYFTCQKEFQSATDVYNRNVFIVLVILGIASIILSFVLANLSIVSLGLSLGGILSLIVASVRYWSAMNDYIRVIVLGLALAVLIWLAVKYFRD